MAEELKPAPAAPATTVAAPSHDSKLQTMKEQLMKLKRIAQLYKDEVGKHKKALTESRTQTQQRNDMIAKLKNSLVAMKEHQKKQQHKYKQQLKQSQAKAAASHSSNHRHNDDTDVLGSRRPTEVVLRIRHHSDLWCLVRFESSDDDDDDDDDDLEDGHDSDIDAKKLPPPKSRPISQDGSNNMPWKHKPTNSTDCGWKCQA